MRYYCSICDRTIQLKSKSKHFISLTHEDYDKFIRINRTIQISNFLC